METKDEVPIVVVERRDGWWVIVDPLPQQVNTHWVDTAPFDVVARELVTKAGGRLKVKVKL